MNTYFILSSEQLVYLGDSVDHHALLLAHPEWATEYAADFRLAGQTGAKRLGHAAPADVRLPLALAGARLHPALGSRLRMGGGGVRYASVRAFVTWRRRVPTG